MTPSGVVLDYFSILGVVSACQRLRTKLAKIHRGFS